MPADSSRIQASIGLGPLIALAMVAVGVTICYWKFAPVERDLSATLTQFVIVRDRDEARTPPLLESLALTVTFANGGDEIETISRARFVISSEEDLSDPRSWSPTIHRDSMLRDLEIPPDRSITHTFVIPWTGRQEARHFPDDSEIHLGFSIGSEIPGRAPVELRERFGHLIQSDGHIVDSEHQLLVFDFPRE